MRSELPLLLALILTIIGACQEHDLPPDGDGENCPPGFIMNLAADRCVSPCNAIQCGAKEYCRVAEDGEPYCECVRDHLPDETGVCRHVCDLAVCGEFEECDAKDGQAVCYCPLEFLADETGRCPQSACTPDDCAAGDICTDTGFFLEACNASCAEPYACDPELGECADPCQTGSAVCHELLERIWIGDEGACPLLEAELPPDGLELTLDFNALANWAAPPGEEPNPLVRNRFENRTLTVTVRRTGDGAVDLYPDLDLYYKHWQPQGDPFADLLPRAPHGLLASAPADFHVHLPAIELYLLRTRILLLPDPVIPGRWMLRFQGRLCEEEHARCEFFDFIGP